MRIAPLLRTALSASDDGVDQIWLELSGATYLDSTVMGCLVGFTKKRGSGPGLILANPSSGCLNAVRQLKLDKLLDIREEPPPADGWIPATEAPASREDLADVVADAHEQLAEANPDDEELARIARAFGRDRDSRSN